MSGSRTNSVFLSSIPLNRKMKRYWISKYYRIATNNGTDYAMEKFKNLRVQLLKYKADPNRQTNLPLYLQECGFRINGMLRKLFEYMDTQPNLVLCFVKMYSSDSSDARTAEEAGIATYHRLEAVDSDPRIPKVLHLWWETLKLRPSGRIKLYYEARRDVHHPYHRAAKDCDKVSWACYWKKWYSLIRRGWTADPLLSGLDSDKLVFPEVYKDFKNTNEGSITFDRDTREIMSWCLFGEDPPISERSINLILSSMDEKVKDAIIDELSDDDFPDAYPFENDFSEESSWTVGQVQHIHKKGGGNDLRDIAVPNRFIQQALVPIARRLRCLLNMMPKDATMDQSKFDCAIQNRVNNPQFYCGSVDLSKATDNLPRSWGDYIITQIMEVLDPLELSDEEDSSLQLFREICSAFWEDSGYHVRWKIGQPLGSLPSFSWLGLTHNLLVEALSVFCGALHSPYWILGDDIVITQKKVRQCYIRLMEHHRVPLSLHKSYEGDLTEFAGKIYVKNTKCFYCSDHSPMGWESLYDWQRSTGIRIPWKNLPAKIQTRIKRSAKKCLSELGICNSTTNFHNYLAQEAYKLSLICEIDGKGSTPYPISDSVLLSGMISSYFELRQTDEPAPQEELSSGIVRLPSGNVARIWNNRFTTNEQKFGRPRPELKIIQPWYRDKFRPCATDAIIDAAVAAVVTDRLKQL